MSTGSAEAVPAPDPEQLNRRMMALGQQALEGRRELSDLLGDAFSELGAAVRGMRELRAELQRRDEVIAALRAAARVDGARSLAGSVSAAPGAPFVNGNGATRAGAAVAPPVVPAERPELTADLFERFAPAGAEALQASLRARIAGALFLGTLRGGDGLPSIRELARRTGLNHKTVRRACSAPARRCRHAGPWYGRCGSARSPPLRAGIDPRDFWTPGKPMDHGL